MNETKGKEEVREMSELNDILDEFEKIIQESNSIAFGMHNKLQSLFKDDEEDGLQKAPPEPVDIIGKLRLSAIRLKDINAVHRDNLIKAGRII